MRMCFIFQNWWVNCLSFIWLSSCWMADLQIQKGMSGAWADDTKSWKGTILDWITPRGKHLSPPLAQNLKSDRGFNHEHTGVLLCPASLNWSDPKWVTLIHLTYTMMPDQIGAAYEKSSEVVRCKSPETNGTYSFICALTLIHRICGMVYFRVLFL